MIGPGIKMNAFVPFTLALAISSASASSLARKSESGVDFEYLLFAQFWPPTSCVYFAEEHDECNIPRTVDGWTVHGLWPSIPGTEKPDYCNSSLKFNYSLIESLSTQLDSNWPYYNKAGPKTELWEHEWTKHGTCAYSLPAFHGELKYFNQTLHLHSFQKTFEVLAKGGIVPSDTAQYTREQIYDVLSKGYGKIVDITCYFVRRTQTYYLEQVWLCFDKQLNRIDCPGVSLRQRKANTLYFQSMQGQDSKAISPYMDCPKKGTVFYKPIPGM